MAPFRPVTPRTLFMGTAESPQQLRQPYIHPSKLAWPEIPHNPQRVTEPLRFPSPIEGHDPEAALSSIAGPQPITLFQSVLRFFRLLPAWTKHDPYDYPTIPYPPPEVQPVGEPDHSDDDDELDEIQTVENILLDPSYKMPPRFPNSTPSPPPNPVYRRRDNSPFFPADDRVPEVWGPEDEYVDLKVATGVANNYSVKRVRISTRTDRQYVASLRGKRLCIFRVRATDMPYFHRVLGENKMASWRLAPPPRWKFDPERSSCWEGTTYLDSEGMPREDPEDWTLVCRDFLHVRKTAQLNGNKMPASYGAIQPEIIVIKKVHVITARDTALAFSAMFIFMFLLAHLFPHPSAYAWPLDA